MADDIGIDHQQGDSNDFTALPSVCNEERCDQREPEKDTINTGSILKRSAHLLPRMHANNGTFGEEGKQLSQRLLNLTVATTSDDRRSITPIPPLRPSAMAEISPSALNKLRAYQNTTSMTNSPCVTDITEFAGNTSISDIGLRLPTFGSSNRGSPSTSQASVGSIPPTLTAALLPSLRHHYDLTPIMRNTSSSHDHEYVEEIARSSDRDRLMTVTPSHDIERDPEDNLYLHGEHLSMPSDFVSTLSTDPSFPQLQPTGLRTVRRDNNVGLSLSDQADMIDLPNNLPPPVEFPARKYYTFTSRQQYEEIPSQRGHLNDIYDHTIKPYQPNREELFDIERLPPEELDQIFIARRGSRSFVRDDRFSIPPPDASAEVTTEDTETHENHRLLHAAIPLEGRQWSIPSLRMAHHLQGSTTSVTDATELEDEDSLVYFYTSNLNHVTSNLPDSLQGFPSSGIVEVHGMDDNLSVSSRGSSLSQHEDLGAGSHFHPSSFPVSSNVAAALDAYVDDNDSVEAVAMGGTSSELEYTESTRHRKRKQQRQKEAYDWIKSVEVNQDVLAEAASSKFLTGGNNQDEACYPQQCLHNQLLRPWQQGDNNSTDSNTNMGRTLHRLSPSLPLQRQISSPATLMKGC